MVWKTCYEKLTHIFVLDTVYVSVFLCHAFNKVCWDNAKSFVKFAHMQAAAPVYVDLRSPLLSI